MSGKYTLIRTYEDGRRLLFDLSTDISERNDLADIMPEKMERIDQRMTEYLNEVNAQMPRVNPDFDTDKSLTLGDRCRVVLPIRIPDRFLGCARNDHLSVRYAQYSTRSTLCDIRHARRNLWLRFTRAASRCQKQDSVHVSGSVAITVILTSSVAS